MGHIESKIVPPTPKSKLPPGVSLDVYIVDLHPTKSLMKPSGVGVCRGSGNHLGTQVEVVYDSLELVMLNS